MRKLTILITLLFIGTLLYYQCKDSPTSDDNSNSDKITGTIKSLAGTPVQGATVTLQIKNVSTTTDASGSFEINTSVVLDNNKDNTYQSNVIDTLIISHNDYLSKMKYIYTNSDIISAIIWDKKFRLSNEVSGWTDLPDNFETFDTTHYYDLIDGGATEYIDMGLVDGILQKFQKGADITCDASVFNFGTSQKAVTMFTFQTENISDSRKMLISGYDESIAVGEKNPLGGSALIYAHFGMFELELNFMGYSDIELLKSDAALFLQVYESKIGVNTR